jgi:hypothetical protein
MTGLDPKYFTPTSRGGMPGNGGGVRTTNPPPPYVGHWPCEGGRLVPNPGQFVGSEPGGPSSGEPIMPERGRNGV